MKPFFISTEMTDVCKAIISEKTQNEITMHFSCQFFHVAVSFVIWGIPSMYTLTDLWKNSTFVKGL